MSYIQKAFNFSALEIGLFVFFCLCFTICFLSVFIFKTKRDYYIRIVFWTMLVMFVLLCSLRSLTMTADTFVYYNHFTSPSALGDIEFGYTFFVTLFNFIFIGNHYLFFAFIPIFNIGIVMLCAKLLKFDVMKLTMAYIATVGLFFSFTVLRAGLSFSFIFLGYTAFKTVKTEWLKYLLTLLAITISILFHITSILIIPIFVVSLIKLPKSKWFYLSFVGAAAAFHFLGIYAMVIEVILPRIEGLSKFGVYLGTGAKNNNLVLHAFLALFVWALLIKNTDNTQGSILKMLTFVLCLYIVFYEMPVIARLRPFILLCLGLFMMHADEKQAKYWVPCFVGLMFIASALFFLNSQLLY